MKILIKISFDGSDFSGFQYQPGEKTVQGTLTEAACRLFGEGTRVTGCSRTDAGVHALGFCATIEPPEGARGPETAKIPAALNFYLPDSVSALAAREVPDGFHPRYSVVDKTYKYLISPSHIRMPLLEGRVYRPPRDLGPDEVAAMDAAARTLEGRHDFSSYMASGSKITDTVRNMKRASAAVENGLVAVTLTADGFLYNMVRIVSGTLLEAGLRLSDPSAVRAVTEARDRSAAGPTLPPYALYLCSVNYGEEYSF